MDINQLNEYINRGYISGLLVAIAFLLIYIAFYKKDSVKGKHK